MPRHCSICVHPERAMIEQGIVANEKYQEISKRFDVSISAIGRHKDNHLKAVIQEFKERRAEQTVQVVEQGEERKTQFVWNLLEEMQWLHEEVHALHEAAKGVADYNATAKALSEGRQQMKLFSELLQGQEQGSREQLEQEWLNVREVIFEALTPYPEAKRAVARALLALGRGESNDTVLSSEQLGQTS